MAAGRPIGDGSALVKSRLLPLLFREGGQKSACLLSVVLQESLSLILRQLNILQLLQQVALPLWKSAAHWGRKGNPPQSKRRKQRGSLWGLQHRSTEQSTITCQSISASIKICGKMSHDWILWHLFPRFYVDEGLNFSHDGSSLLITSLVFLYLLLINQKIKTSLPVERRVFSPRKHLPDTGCFKQKM